MDIDVTMIETEKLKKIMRSAMLWDILEQQTQIDFPSMREEIIIDEALTEKAVKCGLDQNSNLQEILDCLFDQEYESFNLKNVLEEVGEKCNE